MPIYQYECSCKAVIEVEQSIHEKTKAYVMCPDCNKRATRKFSNFGIILQGGGWGSKP